MVLWRLLLFQSENTYFKAIRCVTPDLTWSRLEFDTGEWLSWESRFLCGPTVHGDEEFGEDGNWNLGDVKDRKGEWDCDFLEQVGRSMQSISMN